MKGDAGLDVDQRHVVRKHVVQLTGDPQPLLPGTGERLLTPHPFLLPRAVAPEGDDLRDRHENEQPGRRPERLADGRRRLVADKRRKP
ncbi:MAG TPA: hypothetical protein VI122_20075, partial [Thermoleophilaceae bacterium]